MRALRIAPESGLRMSCWRARMAGGFFLCWLCVATFCPPLWAQQPGALPPVSSPPPLSGLGAPEEVGLIEVPYQQTVTVEIPGATQVLSVNPDIVEATLNAQGLVELRAAMFGKTFLHIWTLSGRLTRALTVVQPLPPRPILAEQRRAAEEIAHHLTFEYRNQFRTFRRGPTLGRTDLHTTTQFDHDLSAQMESPYGKLSSRVSFQRVNNINELTGWNAALRDGTVGPLQPFDVIAGDSSVGFSDLTLPNSTVRGVQFHSRALEPYMSEAFYGRRRLGFATSSTANGEEDFFFSGFRLAKQERPWTWEVAYAGASGDDRAEIQASQAVEARSWYWPTKDLGFGAEVGRTQEEAFGYRLRSSLRGGEVWNLDATYRNLSQRYENLLGRSAEQGERGLLLSSRYAPRREWKFYHRLDVYRDGLFSNPEEPEALNFVVEGNADIDLTSRTLWSSFYERRKLLGRLFPTDSMSLTTSLRQRLRHFPLLDNGTAFGEYRFRDSRSVNAPASDFESHSVRLGLGAPLAEYFSWQVSQQWTFLQETLSGAESIPRETSAGISYVQRFKRVPLTLRGAFNVSATANAESPNSFLADENRMSWTAGLQYDLSQEARFFLDSRILRRERSGAREYEIELQTGVRYFFDTGLSWQPSASLSGVVFKDLDGDGVQETGELGLPEVRVVAATDHAALTDSGGRFYLSRVRGRELTVAVDLSTTPHGHVPTTPSEVKVDLTHPPVSLLFGFVAQSELRIRVFIDANGDGSYDATDVPMEGARLELTDNGVIVTDRSGWAFFRGLSPGAYTVALQVGGLPSGYVPATLAMQERTLKEGDAVLVDFPIDAERSIGGRVYVDRNRNALYDNEPVLAGVEVCLDDERRVKTREDGRYLFKGITAGLRRVALNCGLPLQGYLPLNATVQTVDVPPQPVQVDNVDFRAGEQAVILQDITADVLRARSGQGEPDREEAIRAALDRAHRGSETPAPSRSSGEVAVQPFGSMGAPERIEVPSISSGSEERAMKKGPTVVIEVIAEVGEP